MGRAKDLIFDMWEQERDEKIAQLLGISYEELSDTDWNLEEDIGNDDMLYGYIVYFNEDSPKHILDKIDGLENGNQVWLSPNAFNDDVYDDYEEQFEAIVTSENYYNKFKQEILNVRNLNNLSLDNNDLEEVLKRQLFITAIGTLETYLSETFISLTNENLTYFRKFVETFPSFKERKFQLNEIYAEYDKLEETARKEMLEIIYHNLSKVKNMYIATFEISFPDISTLSKAINTRHDLVHRNGKTKRGDKVIIDKDKVDQLLIQIETFVDEIEESLNNDSL